jgi:hypothetical protein
VRISAQLRASGGSEGSAALRQAPKIESVVVRPSYVRCNDFSQAAATMHAHNLNMTGFLYLKTSIRDDEGREGIATFRSQFDL